MPAANSWRLAGDGHARRWRRRRRTAATNLRACWPPSPTSSVQMLMHAALHLPRRPLVVGDDDALGSRVGSRHALLVEKVEALLEVQGL